MSNFDEPGAPPPPKKLGKLAQSARGKRLNQLRTLLIVVGIIVIGRSIWDIVQLNDLRKNPLANVNVIDALTPVVYGFLGIGVLYCVFAVFAKQYPVAIAVVSLVLFIAMEAIAAVVTDFNYLKGGWILRIAVPVGLIQAIQTGIAYEKERSAQGVEPPHE